MNPLPFVDAHHLRDLGIDRNEADRLLAPFSQVSETVPFHDNAARFYGL